MFMFEIWTCSSPYLWLSWYFLPLPQESPLPASLPDPFITSPESKFSWQLCTIIKNDLLNYWYSLYQKYTESSRKSAVKVHVDTIPAISRKWWREDDRWTRSNRRAQDGRVWYKNIATEETRGRGQEVSLYFQVKVKILHVKMRSSQECQALRVSLIGQGQVVVVLHLGQGQKVIVSLLGQGLTLCVTVMSGQECFMMRSAIRCLALKSSSSSNCFTFGSRSKGQCFTSSSRSKVTHVTV